jgi:hypothetical protein
MVVSREPDYDDKDQLEEKQEKEIGEVSKQETTNYILKLSIGCLQHNKIFHCLS